MAAFHALSVDLDQDHVRRGVEFHVVDHSLDAKADADCLVGYPDVGGARRSEDRGNHLTRTVLVRSQRTKASMVVSNTKVFMAASLFAAKSSDPPAVHLLACATQLRYKLT